VNIKTVRAVALHKMIRLITIASADSGYLNFMGNEFGHPEWVDFPSEQNNYSFHYARRLWSLKYDRYLYYSCLFEFDRQMIRLVTEHGLFYSPHRNLLYIHEKDQVLAFERMGLIFVFNFNHSHSFFDYTIEAPAGEYRMILNSDDIIFGGKERLKKDQLHFTRLAEDKSKKRHLLSLYLPTRTAIILKQQQNM